VGIDVDGTLTDGGMYHSAEGEPQKKFDTRDAKGLERLRANGIRVCILSQESSPAVAARMSKLKIDDYFPGVVDKLELLQRLAGQWHVELAQVAYVGDDLNDLQCLERVGLSCCPANAVPDILRTVDYVCEKSGGAGAVREVCDLILEAEAGRSA
jgi:N-acylneuraminate cytidylyltransferase